MLSVPTSICLSSRINLFSWNGLLLIVSLSKEFLFLIVSFSIKNLCLSIIKTMKYCMLLHILLYWSLQCYFSIGNWLRASASTFCTPALQWIKKLKLASQFHFWTGFDVCQKIVICVNMEFWGMEVVKWLQITHLRARNSSFELWYFSSSPTNILLLYTMNLIVPSCSCSM